MEKQRVFMVCDSKTDLPFGVFDTRKECMEFLECSRTTLWNMEKNKAYYRGMYLEIIFL